MFRKIQIEGYRSFSNFEMSDLGHVNLLVGENNSGKSSVLEAVYLLATQGSPGALRGLLERRGERLQEERTRRQEAPSLDVSHLFHGHNFDLESRIQLGGFTPVSEQTLEVTVSETNPEQSVSFPSNEVSRPDLWLRLDGQPTPPVTHLPLSGVGGLRMVSRALGGNRSHSR